jgi:DMSO/TMAO reductase YedYZ molybdopterin-dependent catalytic subunit
VKFSFARVGIGALVGLVAGAAAVGAGELVAAFVRPAASPVIAVGNRLILLTPESVKRWAIRQFGTQDKHVLLTGIYLGIAVLAIAIGVLAMRRIALGVAGVAVLGAVGIYSALTAHAHESADVVPSILGAMAGVGALVLLVRGATPLTNRARHPGRSAVGLTADRRTFLQTTVATAGLAAIGGFGGRALQRNSYDASAARSAVVLPSAQAAPTAATSYDLGKSGLPFLTPTGDFYRIDTALSVPQINPATWKLRIHGMVDRELVLTYADLLARPQVERWITLTCVSNEVGGDLIGNAKFQGVLLADILREVGVADGADQLIATSQDGMTIGSPTKVVMDGRDAMLAVGMNGQPLPTVHGFPTRMVVPGLYGYVSACKWIVDLEATTFAADAAYWVQGGWAQLGPIKLASRIDSPKSSGVINVGSTVPIAGIAWDQHVGVSAVQVQIDGGEWQTAQLAPVPSVDTWRQWVYIWTVPSAGTHRIRVRAVDAGGKPQDEAAADPFPSGATGLHTITVRAR